MMIIGVVPTEHCGKMQTEGISPKARVSCMTSVEHNDSVQVGGSCSLVHSSESLCLDPCLALGRRRARQARAPRKHHGTAAETAAWPFWWVIR